MPQYIVSGKDLHSDASIKVTADSDEEAWLAAKEQLPLISGMERIEPDGTLKPVTHLPFEDISRPLVSETTLRQEHTEKLQRQTQVRRRILYGSVFIFCFILWRIIRNWEFLVRLFRG